MNSTQTSLTSRNSAEAENLQDSGLSQDSGSECHIDINSIVQPISSYEGPERRSSRRIPRSLEVSVQPLDDQMTESGSPFFAITRDISQGGLAYLSSRRADFSKAVVSLNDGIAPGIVCRVCNSSFIHSSGVEEYWLTNVEFLYLHKPRK